jgi:hypothetical protein
MTTGPHRRHGINLAIELLFDHHRTDRHLVVADDGSIQATDSVDWINKDGHQSTRPHVTVAACYDQETSTAEDDDVNQDAEAIIKRLLERHQRPTQAAELGAAWAELEFTSRMDHSRARGARFTTPDFEDYDSLREWCKGSGVKFSDWRWTDWRTAGTAAQDRWEELIEQREQLAAQ